MVFYDSVSVLPPSLNDVFKIDDICLPEYFVNCDFHTHKDVTLDVSSTSPALSSITSAYIASSMTNVNLLFSGARDSFAVIFNTGTSLAISFDEHDFVGPIRPLTNYMLVGLANGVAIEGNGTVKWKFHTKTAVIMATSSCYYIPAARARLISPQHLFCEKLSVTGRFLVE